jgi:transglutaminase-like putative cysteine protease
MPSVSFKSWRVYLFLAAGLLISPAALAAPVWLLDDAALPLPKQAPDVPAIVLRDDVALDVDKSGEWVETRHVAVRLLEKTSERFAMARVEYLAKSDDVTKLRCWLIRKGREEKSYRMSDGGDGSLLDRSTLYTDYRQKFLNATGDAEPGDVFGFETVVKRTAELGQGRRSFSDRLPVVHAGLEIRVPAGWKPVVYWFNHPAVDPQISRDRRTWMWELKDLPYAPPEPWAPNDNHVIAAFSLSPPAGLQSATSPNFDNWSNVTAWLSSLMQPQCDESPSLTAKAQALVKDCPDDLSRIDAIARYVQHVPYAASDQNTGIGFGVRPHKATEVLACHYGDCKDKANLMCALLREVGYRAHLVVVFATDRSAVHPEWASPAQFNHAIVAVEAPSDVNLPVVENVDGYGRLLFFDATAEWVPLGELPWDLQGSRGAIVGPHTQQLVQLPFLPEADQWRSDKTTRLTLDANGQLSGSAHVVLTGLSAADARGLDHRSTQRERTEAWTKQFSRTVTAVEIKDVRPTDSAVKNQFETEIDFSAPVFGQRVQDELWILHLDLFVRDAHAAFSEKPRRQPALLHPIHDNEEVSMNIPDGFVVDELPAVQELKSDFGDYRGEFAVEAGRVIYRRSFSLRNLRVMPADYGRFRQFLTAVSKAEHTPLILRTKKS